MTTLEQNSGPPTDKIELSYYPSGVGTKFDIDGNVKAFPGNTIICHLDMTSDLSSGLIGLHEKLRTHRLSHLYSLLPPPSWHMTVFEGVVDAVRVSGYWPSDLPADAALTECDHLFEQKLANFDLQLEPPIAITVSGWQPLANGIALHLVPSTAAQEVDIRALRSRLARALRIRHPGHDTYVFHLSIAYLIRHPSVSERTDLQGVLDDALKELPVTFELGAPEFCCFQDMFEFRRRFFLRGA